MPDEFTFPTKCRVFKNDVPDIAAAMERAADWIRKTPNISVQDVVGTIDSEDRAVVSVYYTQITPS